jgi:hypothetical protein
MVDSYQLMNDWTDSSIITIDGVDFFPCGFDDNSSFSEKDLQDGLQSRIHAAVKRVAVALNITQAD